MSTRVQKTDSPRGETITCTVGPETAEALRDFAGTFGISLNHAACIIMSEYLDRAGYIVETVPYEEGN